MRAFARGLLAALAVIGIGLALLFLALPARAQLLLADGTVNGTCGPAPRVPPLPVPAPVIPPQADLPAQATVTAAAGIPTPASLPAQIGGTGTRAVIDLNAKGVAIGWWLPQVGSVKLYLYAVTWSHLAANPGLAARLVLLAAAPSRDSATVAAIGTAYAPTLHIMDMCDVWSPLVATLNASKPAPLDPNTPPPWVATHAVKPNPSAADLTRPVLALAADGTLGAKVLGRAQPGTDCDTRLPTRPSLGTDLYATPVGRASGEVALCAKKP